MNTTPGTVDEWMAQWAEKRAGDARANRLFNGLAIDQIINAVGLRYCPPTLQREGLAAALERVARHYSFRHEANDRPPDGEAREWFDGLASDLAKVRHRLANPPRSDPDLLRKSMVVADIDPDIIGEIRNTFDSIPLAERVLDKVLRKKSYGLGRIGSQLGSPENSSLIGKALPKVFEEHFGRPFRMSRNYLTRKPDGPGIRFIVEVLSVLKLVTRDGMPFTPEAVEYYIRSAPR